MPSPWIKKIAKETDTSERDAEKLWRKAIEIAEEEFGKTQEDFSSKEYSYAYGVVKKMLGIDESILDPSLFLESEFSAKEYIETVVSGNFSIGNVKPPKEDEDEDEDEDDLEEASVGAMRQVNPGIEDPPPQEGEGKIEFDSMSSEDEEEDLPSDEIVYDSEDHFVQEKNKKRWTEEELLEIEKRSTEKEEGTDSNDPPDDIVAQLDRIIEEEMS